MLMILLYISFIKLCKHENVIICQMLHYISAECSIIMHVFHIKSILLETFQKHSIIIATCSLYFNRNECYIYKLVIS